MVTFLREPKTSTIFGIEQQPSGVRISASEDSIDPVGSALTSVAKYAN